MNCSICTLFEGSYHFGTAALVNSLFANGFKGNIYAGYRGTLPGWCSTAAPNLAIEWSGAKTLTVSADVKLHLLPLDTDHHFTNFKPDLMLQLWQGPASDADAMFYFDPDIVITAGWSCFEQWAACGVALSEDVNSPLPEFHPRRMAWREYYGERGVCLQFKEGFYANGGFVGVVKRDIEFLNLWQKLQQEMSPAIGGLSRSSLTGPQISRENKGPFAPFGKTDQDALNATVEAWKGRVSFAGKETMGFQSGLTLMPHALGHPKPWNWHPLSQMVLGRPPRVVDREYWKNVNKPIKCHSATAVVYRKIFIDFAAFVGRFYRRG